MKEIGKAGGWPGEEEIPPRGLWITVTSRTMNSSFVPCQTTNRFNRFPDQWLNVGFVQPAPARGHS